MPAPAPRAERIRDVNVRYHDGAAAAYDSKWGIDFGPVGRDQVRAKLAKALGGLPEAPFGEALEIGAGTGYFTLNLLQLGLIERATATDISPGMLDVLAASAAELGLEVETATAEAESLPYEDRNFDLVFGHAVLHHLPDLDRAAAEMHRVLRPGGTIAFCGEPSRYGQLIATVPKRFGALAAPAWRLALGAGRRDGATVEAHGDRELEREVDVHVFSPATLRRTLAGAGLTDVRVRGEELLANLYGWTARTMESTAEPDSVPMAWRRFAFRSYLALQRVDGSLESRLPPDLFYNLLVSARRPPD
jgi:SAM-dependent methyltransferase